MPPPRLRVRSRTLRTISLRQQLETHGGQQWRCASVATAASITPAPPIESMNYSSPPIQRYPLNQPPSHKRPEFRKTQLLRQYASLIQSSPLILLFQHNNLFSTEWMSLRRELAKALRKVDDDLAQKQPDGAVNEIADDVKIQIIQGSIFNAALRIVEFYQPTTSPQATVRHATDPSTSSSAEVPNTMLYPEDPHYTHVLSTAAWESARQNRKKQHGLESLLSGPLAVVSFPSMSPMHLAAVLRTLAPDSRFEAPKRRANPSYHEPAVQAGLQKLFLLGARVEGRVFDDAQVRWVGGIEGGLDGLRAQLVALLQNAGAGITRALEGAGNSVYFTLSSRKSVLEDEAKGAQEKAQEEK